MAGTTANRTASGDPSAAARKKYGGKSGDFPVFDEKSARAAAFLCKTGHGTPAQCKAAKARAIKRGFTGLDWGKRA